MRLHIEEFNYQILTRKNPTDNSICCIVSTESPIFPMKIYGQAITDFTELPVSNLKIHERSLGFEKEKLQTRRAPVNHWKLSGERIKFMVSTPCKVYLCVGFTDLFQKICMYRVVRERSFIY